MDKQASERFVRRIIDLGHQIESPFSGEPDILRMWMSAGQFFSLPPAGIVECGAIIRDLLKTPGWAGRFSPAYIQQRVKPLLQSVFQDGEFGAGAAFEQIVAELDAFADRHTVFLPITGVELEECDNWQRGPITLHRTTEAFLQAFCIGKGPDIAYIQRNSEARVWAECSFVAEPKRAQTLAVELCGRLIDVFRFWMAASSAQRNFPVGIALEGDFADGSRMQIVRSPDGGIIWDNSPARGLAPLVVGARLMEATRPAHCLLDFAFEPGKQTSFCKLIMHAVRSFGKGKVSPHGEDRVLGYRALRGHQGYETVRRDDAVAEARIPFVIPEKIRPDMPDTRARRAFETDSPEGLSRFESTARVSSTDGATRVIQLTVGYEPAPGYILAEDFCARHQNTLRAFAVRLLDEVPKLGFVPQKPEEHRKPSHSVTPTDPS